MTHRAKQWVAEWLEGLGRITLLAKESIASLLTFKVAWRNLLCQTTSNLSRLGLWGILWKPKATRTNAPVAMPAALTPPKNPYN
jgi:hypothetical protein